MKISVPKEHRAKACRDAPIAMAMSSALVLLLSACAYVREATYPSDFSYLSEVKVSSAMGRMADHVYLMENAMVDASLSEPERQREVVSQLEGIERVAGGLGAGMVPTNHLVIDANIDAFRRRVEAARASALRDPPDYYLAGSLAGACSACHLRR